MAKLFYVVNNVLMLCTVKKITLQAVCCDEILVKFCHYCHVNFN